MNATSSAFDPKDSIRRLTDEYIPWVSLRRFDIGLLPPEGETSPVLARQFANIPVFVRD
jgi:hypothetical protein